MTRGAPDEPREQRRLDQPLQIDRDVVAASAQLANRGEQRRRRRRPPGRACRRSLITSRRSIDRHEIENLAMLGADQPVDARRRKRAAQRRRDRDGVHDVAERAQTDDQETVHD